MDYEKILQKLDRRGVYTVESIFKGMGYAFKDGTIAIFAGKSGDLRIDLKNADEFLNELTGIVELARERKGKKVAGI